MALETEKAIYKRRSLGEDETLFSLRVLWNCFTEKFFGRK